MCAARRGMLVLALVALMTSAGLADIFGPPSNDADINMRAPDSNAGSSDRIRVRNRIGHPSHPENWQSDGLAPYLEIEWVQTPVATSTWSQIKALFR